MLSNRAKPHNDLGTTQQLFAATRLTGRDWVNRKLQEPMDSKAQGSTPRQSYEDDSRSIEVIRRAGQSREAEEAYRHLVEKYWETVMLLAASKIRDVREAEDVAQESFARAFRSLDRLQEPSAFLGWLLRITRNIATDHLRTRRSELPLSGLNPATIESGRKRATESEDTDHRERSERAEEVEAVLQALQELPDAYREVITLKYLHQMDGRTMARKLGEPEGTIRNRLFRALRKLRQTLEPRTMS